MDAVVEMLSEELRGLKRAGPPLHAAKVEELCSAIAQSIPATSRNMLIAELAEVLSIRDKGVNPPNTYAWIICQIVLNKSAQVQSLNQRDYIP